MVLTIDAETNGATNGTVNSITVSHTVSSSANKLIVVLGSETSGTGARTWSATFNGVSMVKAREDTVVSTSRQTTVIFYLDNDFSFDNSAHNIIVSYSETAVESVIIAGGISLFNAKQGAVDDSNGDTETASDGDLETTVTPIGTDNICIGVGTVGTNDSMTIQNSWTEHFDLGLESPNSRVASGYIESQSGTQTARWTFTNNARKACTAIAISSGLLRRSNIRSLYELLHPLGVIAGQQVIDNFSGDTLNERWVEDDEQGTGSFVMQDAIDGGFRVTCENVNNSTSLINFGDINHYESQGSVFIAVGRSLDTTNERSGWGLIEDNALDDRYVWEKRSTSTLFRITSEEAGSGSNVNSSISLDENWHTFRAQKDSVKIRGWLDGNFEVLHTSNQVTADLQPGIYASATTANTKETDIRYFEAWNT